ncbi:hypothetical protein AMEX_G12755, partial [Astyanax mexicanus]
GQPRLTFSEELLTRLIEIPLPVSCIANLLGFSQSTIFRRMREHGLSTRSSYSSFSDDDLDNAVMSIKRKMPTAGYRMVKGALQADGHRVQWSRIKESMHRVDATGVLERMTELRCIVRRTYFVQHPLALVHVDTNHKLIRVRGDEGVENVGIAETMFTVKGTGRGNFVAGKSVIERLWRDVRLCVTQLYYEGWDNHPLRSEGGLSPNQLWIMGHMQNSSANSEEDLQVCIKTLHLALNSCGAAYCPKYTRFCIKLVVSCKVIECFRIWSCLEQTGSHLMAPMMNLLEFKSLKLRTHSLLL